MDPYIVAFFCKPTVEKSKEEFWLYVHNKEIDIMFLKISDRILSSRLLGSLSMQNKSG